MRNCPYGLDLILCDDVIIEEGMQRASLIRQFNALEVSRFPAKRSFFVFAVVTDWVGECDLQLEISSFDGSTTLFETDRHVEFTHREQRVNLVFPVQSCVFPQAGKYQATLKLERDWVGHRLFDVRKREGR